jgi:hypothetical protein
MGNQHHASHQHVVGDSYWRIKVQQRVDTSRVRRTDRSVGRYRIGIVLSWLVLAATAATAQPSGGSPSESVATLRNRDLNGTVTVNEQTVTRRSETNEGDQLIIETYLPSIEGGRLALARRVRRTTTAGSNGIQTVEETEERNPVAPSEPLRTVRRSVTTVRRIGTDSYASERQVFEVDVNGRFVPVATQTER